MGISFGAPLGIVNTIIVLVVVTPVLVPAARLTERLVTAPAC